MGTKSVGDFEFTAGFGFGRLAGENSFSNPLGNLSSHFTKRGSHGGGIGGTLGNINWFTGDAAAFYGLSYQLGNRFTLSSEYNPDFMAREGLYMDIKSNWNFGVSYQVSDYLNLSAQYLHGSEFR